NPQGLNLLTKKANIINGPALQNVAILLLSSKEFIQSVFSWLTVPRV
ncbi:1045_t:CDS:2, partial [Funneliformis mosseae]